LICGEACRISCRELLGFGETTIFTVSDFTSPRGSGASPILTGGVISGSFRYQTIFFSFGRISDS